MLSLLTIVYEIQYARVKWDSAKSDVFPKVNGTRQESVLSPTILSVYVDDSIEKARGWVLYW